MNNNDSAAAISKSKSKHLKSTIPTKKKKRDCTEKEDRNLKQG